MIYDDDDPLNRTAADNAEWLTRFKQNIGLAASEEGPGLPINQPSSRISMGRAGFSLPYLHPKAPLVPYIEDVAVKIDDKTYKAMHNILDSNTTLTDLIPDYSHPDFIDDMSMLGECDMELGTMSVATDFGTGQGMRLGMGSTSAIHQPHEIPKSFAQDHDKPYRVHSATAGPLQRRTSEKLAAQVGLSYHPQAE